MRLARLCRASGLMILLLSTQASATSPPSDSMLTAMSTAAQRLEPLHNIVIAHQGEIMHTYHQSGPAADEPVNIKSLSKTVLAALVGAAIEEGIIESVEQPVVELLGSLVPVDADPKVEEISVGHLLSMQAGLERTSGDNYSAWVANDNWVAYVLNRPFEDDPGGIMLYSTGSSHLLSAALTQVSGESTLALARRLLGEPLDIRIPAWPRDPQGIYFGGNNMRLSPLALIQIGELYRNDGRVGDHRLLPKGWVETSWKTRGTSKWTGHGYGYGWYNTQIADEMVYYGRGYGGQALYVVPSRDLTVVITSNPHPPSPGRGFQGKLNRLMDILLTEETQVEEDTP